MHRAFSIVGEVKGQAQGRAKGQIYLIGYNFASNFCRDFKLGSYFCLSKATPNTTMTLTFELDLVKFTKVKIFETYQLTPKRWMGFINPLMFTAG